MPRPNSQKVCCPVRPTPVCHTGKQTAQCRTAAHEPGWKNVISTAVLRGAAPVPADHRLMGGEGRGRGPGNTEPLAPTTPSPRHERHNISALPSDTTAYTKAQERQPTRMVSRNKRCWLGYSHRFPARGKAHTRPTWQTLRVGMGTDPHLGWPSDPVLLPAGW